MDSSSDEDLLLLALAIDEDRKQRQRIRNRRRALQLKRQNGGTGSTGDIVPKTERAQQIPLVVVKEEPPLGEEYLESRNRGGYSSDENEHQSDSDEDSISVEVPVLKHSDVTSKPLHHGVTCTYCQEEIEGHRYKCLQCESINMCTSCESSGQHPRHCVLRLPSPATYALVMACLTPVMTALNQRIGVSTLGKQIAILPSEIKQEMSDEPLIEYDLNSPILSAINDPLGSGEGTTVSADNVESESRLNMNPVTKWKSRNEKKSTDAKLNSNKPTTSKVQNKRKTPIQDMSKEIIDKKRRRRKPDDPLSTQEVGLNDDIKSPSSSQKQHVEGSKQPPQSGAAEPRNLADDMLEMYDIKIEVAEA